MAEIAWRKMDVSVGDDLLAYFTTLLTIKIIELMNIDSKWKEFECYSLIVSYLRAIHLIICHFGEGERTQPGYELN